MAHRLFSLLCLATTVGASRVQMDLEGSSEEERAARASAWAGQVLRGRYRLLELHENNPFRKMNPVHKLKKMMKKHKAKKEGKAEEEYVPRSMGDFPWGLSEASPLSQKEFAEPAELGRGSYGDAWKALDTKTQEEVVIKIFYMYSTYVTKKLMEVDEDAAAAVEEGDEECKLVHGMLASDSSYPEGKSHVCNCLASHASDQQRDDDVSFLVLEQCGQSLKGKLMAQWQEPKDSFHADARHWMKGVLAAVRFMSGLERPMLHLDIHWDNVVITKENEAKLIDFGFTQAFDEPFPEVEHWRAPPEHVWTPGGTMAQYPRDKAWAYDVWSTGALYSELLCGQPSFPFNTEDVVSLSGFKEGQSHFRCKAGEAGSGGGQDWAMVNAALTGYDHRKSPEELMALLDLD